MDALRPDQQALLKALTVPELRREANRRTGDKKVRDAAREELAKLGEPLRVRGAVPPQRPMPAPRPPAEFKAPAAAIDRIHSNPLALARDLFEHDLPGGAKSRVLAANETTVAGVIVNKNGRTIGTWRRNFLTETDSGEPPQIYNAILKVEKRAPKGVGSTFVKLSTQRASREGFTAANVSAAGDGGRNWSGGYVWARAGYDFTHPWGGVTTKAGQPRMFLEYNSGTRGDLSRAIAANLPYARPFLTQHPELLDEWIALLDRTPMRDTPAKVPGNPPTPFEFSELGRGREINGVRLGKLLMLHSNWSGTMPLNAPEFRSTVQASAGGDRNRILADAWSAWSDGHDEDDAYAFDQEDAK